MQEKDIEAKLVAGVKKAGGECLKFVSPGFVGVPDRIILLPGGKACFAETKAPGKSERPRQRYVQEKLRCMGFVVFPSVNSQRKIDEVLAICQELAKR